MKVLNVVDMHRRTAPFPNAAFLLPGEQILSTHATQKVTPSHLVKGTLEHSGQLWIEKR